MVGFVPVWPNTGLKLPSIFFRVKTEYVIGSTENGMNGKKMTMLARGIMIKKWNLRDEDKNEVRMEVKKEKGVAEQFQLLIGWDSLVGKIKASGFIQLKPPENAARFSSAES